MGQKKVVIQHHHIVYPSPDRPEQELTVKLRKCEHLIATKTSWFCRKTVTKGFIKWMKCFIAMNEDRAIDL